MAVTAYVQQLEGGTVTWHDLAQKLADCGLINVRAPSELALVRRAVENMKHAGELVPVGDRKTAWSRRPLKLYGARKAAVPDLVGDDLTQVLGHWLGPATDA